MLCKALRCRVGGYRFAEPIEAQRACAETLGECAADRKDRNLPWYSLPRALLCTGFVWLVVIAVCLAAPAYGGEIRRRIPATAKVAACRQAMRCNAANKEGARVN